MTDYRTAVSAVMARGVEWEFDPTLDRIRDLLDLLGEPQRACPVILVAGTNGKSSVSRMIDALLTERGLRVGRFTSPHLSELRERIALHLTAAEPGDVLPLLAAAENAGEEPQQPPAGESGLAGRTVLVVDDDARNVFALTGMLELHGMRVLHADNGRAGIETLQAHDETELVLMDVMMPEMDGYAATTAIREMPRYADLPIIAVTAKAMQGDREKSLAAGASDYVTKPVDADLLIAAIQRLLER